jgi:hypothetical protein
MYRIVTPGTLLARHRDALVLVTVFHLHDGKVVA